MKIVFLSDDFPPQSFGGAGISTHDLARGMKANGHEVFVITTCRKKEEASVYTYNGITVHRIQSAYHPRWRAYVSVWNIFATRKIASILNEIRPDVVHANNIHAHLSFYSLVVARKYAGAVLFTARDTMSVSYGKLSTKRYIEKLDPYISWKENLAHAKLWYNPIYTYAAKKYLAYAHARLSVSDALRQALEKNGIRGVQAMHTGLDVTEWGASPHEIQAFKKKFAIEGKKIILHSGRLSPSKGSDKLIDAMRHVVKEVPDAVLVIAGFMGPQEEKIQREFGQRLVCTGWIDRADVRISFAASDVVVVPSLYLDPFPRVVLEAMASKKPVVGSCYGGSKEVIVDTETGYVIDPHDSATMAEKIITLLKDQARAEQFGEKGYERIRTKFNLKDKIELHAGLYKSILDASKHSQNKI